jgi:hypothetical protein
LDWEFQAEMGRPPPDKTAIVLEQMKDDPEYKT